MKTERKVVMITGASGGLGRGIALACAAQGWSVWVAARRESAGNNVAAEITRQGGVAQFVHCDAGVQESVETALATVLDAEGRLDGLVHNATSGLSPRPGAASELSLSDLRDHITVSLRGSYLLARAAFEPLKQSQGALVLLSSEAGFEGKARLPAYATVKAAQRGFARSLAREWGSAGIRVNCVAPLAATEAMDDAFRRDPDMEERVLGRHPMRRLGDSVMDIGPAVCFLLSQDSRYITGHTLMVDGGSCPVT